MKKKYIANIFGGLAIALGIVIIIAIIKSFFWYLLALLLLSGIVRGGWVVCNHIVDVLYEAHKNIK